MMAKGRDLRVAAFSMFTTIIYKHGGGDEASRHTGDGAFTH